MDGKSKIVAGQRPTATLCSDSNRKPRPKDRGNYRESKKTQSMQPPNTASRTAIVPEGFASVHVASRMNEDGHADPGQ